MLHVSYLSSYKIIFNVLYACEIPEKFEFFNNLYQVAFKVPLATP